MEYRAEYQQRSRHLESEAKQEAEAHHLEHTQPLVAAGPSGCWTDYQLLAYACVLAVDTHLSEAQLACAVSTVDAAAV